MAGLTAEARAGSPLSVPRGRPRRNLLLVCAGVLVLVVIGLLTMMFGAVTLSAGEALGGLGAGSDSLAGLVVGQIRLPRFLDAILVGALLGVAGALLQGVTRNPLGDPTIFGLTAAAGLASATAISINPQIPQWGIALACMSGGLGGAAILFVIAYRGAVSPVRLALAGVALSALFGAFTVALLASVRTFLQTTLGFLAGGLYGADWSDFRSILPYALPALVARPRPLRTPQYSRPRRRRSDGARCPRRPYATGHPRRRRHPHRRRCRRGRARQLRGTAQPPCRPLHRRFRQPLPHSRLRPGGRHHRHRRRPRRKARHQPLGDPHGHHHGRPGRPLPPVPRAVSRCSRETRCRRPDPALQRP